MIMQLINIFAGAVLASDTIGKFFGRDKLVQMNGALAPHRAHIGLGVLVLGFAALIDRLDIILISNVNFGASFPQAIPAIFAGFILSAPFFSHISALKNFADALSPHAQVIGIVSILIGLGSLLFGCIAPVCYPFPF